MFMLPQTHSDVPCLQQFNHSFNEIFSLCFLQNKNSLFTCQVKECFFPNRGVLCYYHSCVIMQSVSTPKSNLERTASKMLAVFILTLCKGNIKHYLVEANVHLFNSPSPQTLHQKCYRATQLSIFLVKLHGFSRFQIYHPVKVNNVPTFVTATIGQAVQKFF